MCDLYEQWKSFGLPLISSGIVLVAAELCYRVLLIIKEITMYKKHYPRKNRLQTIIKNGLTFNFQTKLCFTAIFFLLAYAIKKDSDMLKALLKQHSSFVLVYILFRYVKVPDSRIDQAEFIRSESGLDYGAGIASNYYNAYLLLQLPEKGYNIKGIRERIEDYEDKHGVIFAMKKLVIIIPDSLHSAPEIDSPYLKRAEPLEVILMGRAGVRRPYKNDVYRFTERINGKIYYITLECAPPLLSFKESMESIITGTPDMKALQREILMKFYKSLKQHISRCDYTRNLCEIVYYPDYDANGHPIDIGLFLLNYMRERLSQPRGY